MTKVYALITDFLSKEKFLEIKSNISSKLSEIQNHFGINVETFISSEYTLYLLILDEDFIYGRIVKAINNALQI